MKTAFVLLLVCIAITFALLGVFELNDPTDQAEKAERLFFGLALIAAGAAAGLLLL